MTADDASSNSSSGECSSRGSARPPRPYRGKHDPRYKTELCRLHTEGYCRFGTHCRFAHGPTELRITRRHPKEKTLLCWNYHSIRGVCHYGQRCRFIHDGPQHRPRWAMELTRAALNGVSS